MLHPIPKIVQQCPPASAYVWFGGRSYAVSIETFTPESAAAALKLNSSNRKLSDANLRVLAGVLRRGEWALNGETVVFADNGRLLQGQHRLTVVIRTGLPITTFVVRGVEESVFKTLDAGKGRSGADALSIEKCKNVNILASAARALCWIETGLQPTRETFSTTMMLDLVNRHPGLTFWASRFANSKLKNFMPSFFAGAVCLFAERQGLGAAEEFFELVDVGAGMDARHPAFVLREKFIGRTTGQTFTGGAQLAYIIKALNAYTKGESISMLRVRDNEAFPELL